MSNLYSLKIILNSSFQTKYISEIITRGAENGCCYVEEYTKDEETVFISPEQAVEKIMYSWEEKKNENKSYASVGIGIQLENVFFNLHFTEKIGYLAPWLSLYSHGWCKKSSYVDFEKYIRLSLLLMQDLEILWLKTYDEGYEEDLYWGVELSYPQLRNIPDLSLSSDFKVDVTILPSYNYEVLYNLLDHGAALGWQYSIKTNSNNMVNVASIEQTIAYILDKIHHCPLGGTLMCLVNDVCYELTFALRVNTRENYSMFTLMPLNTSSVPLSQTVLHALDLCTDFCILELNTFDARYNYIRSALDDVK